MEVIIAILLWINAMSAGGHDTQALYNDIVSENQAVINQVYNDPTLQATLISEYGLVATTVVIGEDD